MESIKKKFKKRETGIKLKTLLILICAVFAFTAPFIHIFYPKIDANLVKEEAILSTLLDADIISQEQYDICYKEAKNNCKVFGFNNIRKFWYAAGKNICMLFFSLVLMYASFFINDREVKKIAFICSFLFMGISVYFVIWVFWWDSDFPKYVYYTAIAVASLLSTTMCYFVLGHFNKILKYLYNIRKLTDFLIGDVEKKYVDKKKSKDYTIDVVNVLDSLEK